MEFFGLGVNLEDRLWVGLGGGLGVVNVDLGGGMDDDGGWGHARGSGRWNILLKVCLGRLAWVRIVAGMAPLWGPVVWVLVVHGVVGWAVLPRRVLVHCSS